MSDDVKESDDAVVVAFPPTRCPFCTETIVSGAEEGRRFCTHCGAPHHQACFDEAMGKCGACSRDNLAVTIEDNTRKSGHCGDCGGELGTISTGCTRCPLWFHQGCGWGHKCIPREPTPMSDEERSCWQKQLDSEETKLPELKLIVDKYQQHWDRSRWMFIGALFVLFFYRNIGAIIWAISCLGYVCFSRVKYKSTLRKYNDNTHSIEFLKSILKVDQEDESGDEEDDNEESGEHDDLNDLPDDSDGKHYIAMKIVGILGILSLGAFGGSTVLALINWDSAYFNYIAGSGIAFGLSFFIGADLDSNHSK